MIDLRKVKYKKRYKKDKIIFVSPTKILDRLQNDSPSFDIRNPKNIIGDRVERAKEWILKNYNNPSVVFEPSVVGIYHRDRKDKVGHISFSDGRHRILAAEELGIPEVAIEIPPHHEKYFEYMKVYSMIHQENMITKFQDFENNI